MSDNAGKSLQEVSKDKTVRETMHDTPVTVKFQSGDAMNEKCSKCGAAAKRDSRVRRRWECGTLQYKETGGIYETHPCLRRQLAQAKEENERLRGIVEKVAEFLDAFKRNEFLTEHGVRSWPNEAAALLNIIEAAELAPQGSEEKADG